MKMITNSKWILSVDPLAKIQNITNIRRVYVIIVWHLETNWNIEYEKEGIFYQDLICIWIQTLLCRVGIF